MSKQKDPAFPHETAIAYCPGLTKLEYFAAAALPGLLASYRNQGPSTLAEVVETAVYLANALLEELEK